MLSALYFFAIFLEIYTKVLTIYRKRYIIINVRRTNKEKVQSTGKEKRQWVRSERKRKSLYSGKT